MSDLIYQTDQLFFDKTGMNQNNVQSLLDDSLHGGDDGELLVFAGPGDVHIAEAFGLGRRFLRP